MIITKARKLPYGWRWVKLKDIALLERGKFSPRPRNDPRYYGGAYPWIQTGDVEAADKYINSYRNTLNKFGFAVSKMFPKGTLVITIAATIGAVGILNFDSCMPDSLVAITPKDGVSDTEFLYYLFLFLREEVKARATKSAQANINLELLEPIEIPLPPLAEQKRIAAIAQKADRLRRTRRYALQLSDTYLQSVFLEMFGDPVTNPKGWEMGTLDDVIISAKDGPHVSPNYSDSGIPFLSTRNVRKGELIWEDLKFISYEDAEQHWKKCKPERGDILYTKGGTTGLAKAIDFDREIAVWVHIAVLKPRRDLVIPNWLETMLNTDFCYKQSQELTFGIVNRDLGLQRMPKIKIYIPPLPLQEKFAQIAQKFERLRTQQREAERQAEHLFQTILHRAFRGELTSEDINEEPASDILEQNPPKQTKPETTAKAGDTFTPDTAKNPNTFAKQQYTEAIQLKLPGFE